MKKILLFLIGLMLCTAAFAQTAKAVKYPTTFYVSPNGTGNGYDKGTPTTLQGAVDSIYNRTVSKNVNFTVVLLDVVDNYGTSSDSVKIIQQENKNITIKSQKAKSPANVGLKFYIDGTNRFDGQEKLVLQDLSFVNEGGIKLWYHTVPETSYVHNITVQNCAFSGNSAHYGLYFQCLNSQSAAYSSCGGRNITIEDCSFVGRENDVFIGRIDTVKINNCKLSGCKKGIEVMFSNNEGRNGYLNMSNTDITMNSQNNEFAFSLGYSTDQPNLQENFTAIVENSNFYGSSPNSGLVRLQKNCPKNLIFKNVALNVSDSSVALNLPRYSDPDFLLNITVSSGLLVINGDLQIEGVSKIDVNHTAIKGVDSYSLFSFNSNSKFYQWKDNQWKEKDTVYVFPEGVTHDITNVVAECKMPDMPLFCFSSVSDAVEFMTISDSSMYLMNTLGLDSVGVRVMKDDILTKTITISTGKNVTLFDDQAIITRDDKLKKQPMIQVEKDAALTIGLVEDADTLIFDGGSLEGSKQIILNNGTLNLVGNIVFRNNIANSNGSAITNNDSLFVSGDVLFQNNITTTDGAGVYNIGTTEANASLLVVGNMKFVNNQAKNGSALYLKNAMAKAESTASLIFENNKSQNGTIYSGNGAEFTIDANAEFHNNSAKNGTSIYMNNGIVRINGYTQISGDTATDGSIIYVNKSFYLNSGLVTGNVCKSSTDSIINGILSVGTNGNAYLKGGRIGNNQIDKNSAYNYIPYSAVLTKKSNAQLFLGDSIMIDTIRVSMKGVYKQKIQIESNLSLPTATNPIVLAVDSFDRQVLASSSESLIKGNYMKFKPSSDTLAINSKGYVVRKPEIAIDTVYLLQKGTKYEDYGITTSTGEVPAEALYVIYTQEVDATGQSAKTTADSLVLNMSVDFNHGSPVMLDKKVLSNNQNTNTFVEIPFPSALTDGALSTGRYTINATAKVYTLGLEASDDFTQSDSVYIPTFDIDTLNFLLAGTKFSDYGYCGVGSSTNDGAGDDIIPMDEIYVGYQRAEGGKVDSVHVKATLKDYNSAEYVYEESNDTPIALESGCGHFRQFTNSAKWTPALNLSDAFDGKEFKYEVVVYTKTQGQPYFFVDTLKGTYKHEIDRECTIALENAEACNAMDIQFSVNEANDIITLTYPNFFDKNAVPAAMKQDGVIKVGISFDPQDPTITMAWFDEATDITQTDNKYIVWIPVSNAISATSPIVLAKDYASTNDTLRLSSTNVKGVYRKTFNVVGTLSNVDTACAKVTYHTTGASGVVLTEKNSKCRYTLNYDNSDYTVWDVQDPVSFGKSADSVYAALYVNRPADTLNRVYISNMMDSVEVLTEDKLHQLTDSAYVHYVALGSCANQATKDYTFDASKSSDKYKRLPQTSGYFYAYWFKDDKFVKAEKYYIRRHYAPKYTVNYHFNDGGATCDNPYSPGFADTTYIFGRRIERPADPFKCGHLFMDWHQNAVDSFTVDSFKNVRAGISEATGAPVTDTFGIRNNHVLDAVWKYFVTIEGLSDTAVVADYSLCEINTRDYVMEPTEAKRPYCYTYHTDYLGKYYREYIPGKNGNCDVKFGDSVYLESPKILPVGQTSQVTWTVTDMCGTPFTLTQNVNVMFPPCGADYFDPAESAYVRSSNNHGSLDGGYHASIDGKDDYQTVRIGCNCWLKENLQNKKYADGSAIPVAKAYLDDETKVPEFGRLYTWYSAVKVAEDDNVAQPTTINETIAFSQTPNTYSRDYVQGVCPTGWHIPSMAEYENLKGLVGSANAIKANNSEYWLGYQDATDAAHFIGVPAGYYDNSTNRYYDILGKTYFWSTENSSVKALPCSLIYGCPEILFNEQNKFLGMSIRCVRNINIHAANDVDFPK